MASFISGAYPGALLGDFGADVIKVELPRTGDRQRSLGTFDPNDDQRSLWWLQLARSKRSVTLDLRRREVRPIVEKLVEWADVITENFRPGTLERWEIGWDWIHAINPTAHLVRISGYGQTGPLRQKQSFERAAQAFSGLMYETGEPSTPPQRAGLPICDYTTGLWGAFGALLALLQQLRSGDRQGQVIDHALYESLIPMLADQPSVYKRTGEVEERTGNRSRRVAPGEAYLTLDGHWIFITVTGDQIFARTMEMIGRPEYTQDPRFATNRDRIANRAALDAAVASWVAEQPRDEALRLLEAAQVPAAPVHNVGELFDHPQTQERENFVEVDDPVIGQVWVTGVFPKLSRTPGQISATAPRVGEHTDSVLVDELGIDPSLVERCRATGAI